MVKTDWGLQPPEGCLAAWGARAIYNNREVDILHDRQGTAGDPEEIKKLLKWLNSKGLTGFRKMLKKEDLLGSDNRVVTYKAGGYVIKANPRASYGYLYLGAWKENPEEL